MVLVEPQARKKGVSVECDVPQDLPVVDADAGRMVQVMRNLLNNAVTATPEGGEIKVKARAVDSVVEVTVQDTGSGIDPEHIPFIFERFYRLISRAPARPAEPGWGWGLSNSWSKPTGARSASSPRSAKAPL